MSSESQTAVAEGRGSRDRSPESPGSADVSDGSTPCGVAEHRPCQLLFDVHERRETKGGDGGARAESARRRSDSRRHLAGRAATTRAYSFRSADDRIRDESCVYPHWCGVHCHWEVGWWYQPRPRGRRGVCLAQCCTGMRTVVRAWLRVMVAVG